MPKLNSVNITFDIENIVKLQCINHDCKHHLINYRPAQDAIHCQLKFLQIGKEGQCLLKENKEDANTSDNMRP